MCILSCGINSLMRIDLFIYFMCVKFKFFNKSDTGVGCNTAIIGKLGRYVLFNLYVSVM